MVAGALGVAAGYPLADPLVGLLITAVILVVLKQATGQMLGRLMDAVEPELVEEVETIAVSVPEVQAVDRLRVRWLGHALGRGDAKELTRTAGAGASCRGQRRRVGPSRAAPYGAQVTCVRIVRPPPKLRANTADRLSADSETFVPQFA